MSRQGAATTVIQYSKLLFNYYSIFNIIIQLLFNIIIKLLFNIIQSTI